MKKDFNEDQTPSNEFDPYALDKLAKFSNNLKINAVKWWCFGAIYFFIGFGIPGMHIWDKLFLMVVIMGFAYEYIIKNMVRVFEPREDKRTKYLAFELKGIKSVILTQVYAYTLMALTLSTIGLIQWFLVEGVNIREHPFGLNPIIFATIVLLYDIIEVYVIRKITSIINNKRGKKL